MASKPEFATGNAIEQAGRILATGGVGIIPTETVYGLAASIRFTTALQRIFTIKGRPNDNPLIIHVLDFSETEELCVDVPKEARLLADHFWPGPLTLVLPKSDAVPLTATAGLATVAVRSPLHPIARAVIAAAKSPLAAPSANPFMEISPTSAENVDPKIWQAVDFFLDGGPCEIGIESTVVDLTAKAPRILRPGRISRQEITEVLGRELEVSGATDSEKGHKSPGQYPRHYSPKASVIVVHGGLGNRPGLAFGPPAAEGQIEMSTENEAYARALFASLKRADEMGAETIFIQAPPTTPEWEAVWDRISRAAFRIDDASSAT